MNIQTIISEIEKLYPFDSDQPDIALTGIGIFEKVKQAQGFELCIQDWRDLPESVLMEYLHQCLLFDKKTYEKRIDFLFANLSM